MKKVFDAVKEVLPKFNNKILVDLRHDELDNAIQFIEERVEEALRITGDDVKLVKTSVVPPFERVSYEMSTGRISNIVYIDQNEMVLVKFDFEFEGEFFSKYLYVPYRYEDMYTVYNGTKYMFQLCLIEKLFSRINNGFTIKVIRAPISFWKNKLYSFKSLSSERVYTETAIEAKVHYRKRDKKNRNRLRPTLIHYLLCKFGVQGTIEKLGLPADCCEFTRDLDDKSTEFEYFKAQNVALTKKPILMKVPVKYMKSNAAKRFVVATLYILNGFKKISLDDLINNSITVFRVMLGRIIYSKNTDQYSAYNYMTDHINSFDSYLDEITKRVFHREGIEIEDIYDMLVYIFFNIDSILLEYTNNNFYNKRFTSFNLSVISSFVVALNDSIYRHEKDKNRGNRRDVVEKMIRIFPRGIVKDMYTGYNVRMNADIFNDNILLSSGMKMIKQLGITKANSSKAIKAPANKFHPSFVTVESLVGFSSSNPSTNAVINPFVEIDENGGVVKNEFSREADKLSKYL